MSRERKKDAYGNTVFSGEDINNRTVKMLDAVQVDTIDDLFETFAAAIAAVATTRIHLLDEGLDPSYVALFEQRVLDNIKRNTETNAKETAQA